MLLARSLAGWQQLFVGGTDQDFLNNLSFKMCLRISLTEYGVSLCVLLSVWTPNACINILCKHKVFMYGHTLDGAM